MPQRKSPAKRLKADKTRKARNLSLKSEIKKEMKGFRALLDQGKLDEAKIKIRSVFQKLDRASIKGLMHKNKASRYKSSLSIKLNKKV